jgi:hypothetical protein
MANAPPRLSSSLPSIDERRAGGLSFALNSLFFTSTMLISFFSSLSQTRFSRVRLERREKRRKYTDAVEAPVPARCLEIEW